jgi:hypothetical protein
MPKLNARAAAEMLKLPAYEQLRILLEQKYPKQGPQPFRIPYYRPAVSAIRNFYTAGNDLSVLAQARNGVQGIGQAVRRTQLLRALQSFEGSPLARRKLRPCKNYQVVASIGDVHIRASPDFQATDGDDTHKVLYVNCKQVPLDPDFAQRLVEVAQWIYAENSIDLPIEDFEVLDLAARKFLRFKRRRPQTIKLLKQNAKVIEALWNAS